MEAQMQMRKASRRLWSFGTREVVFAAIGAALYGVLSALTNVLQIPAAGNVAIRPAVGIVFFFGIAFGPIVGFITGFLGNILADLLSGGGFWFWWDLGNGLMGLIAGLFAAFMIDYKSWRDIVFAEIAVVLGAAIGMFIASLSEMWVTGVEFATTIAINFTPSFITNIVMGLIITPILMVAYSAIIRRSGR
ncbi:MAG: ECF transporter S component [Chloroflexi bacterium]|nr:ECF transporter S component [Chloroflexota bacterium]